MSRAGKKLALNDDDYDYLRSLIKQRTIQAQVVIRAYILLDSCNETPIRCSYWGDTRKSVNSD